MGGVILRVSWRVASCVLRTHRVRVCRLRRRARCHNRRAVPLLRAFAAGFLLAVMIPACTPTVPDEHRAAALTALDGLRGWLEKSPPTENTAFGFQCLDAWSWFMFSEWHPDARARASAGEVVDARLRGIQSPPTWTGVTLSYWALALRLMAHRALPIEAHLTQLAGVDVTGALARSTPTTRWWTLALLKQAGAPVADPDPRGTFLASRVATGETQSTDHHHRRVQPLPRSRPHDRARTGTVCQPGYHADQRRPCAGPRCDGVRRHLRRYRRPRRSHDHRRPPRTPRY